MARCIARGYITGFDEEYDKAWTVTYEADGVKEEYDSDDVRKYAIDCINGKSEESQIRCTVKRTGRRRLQCIF